MVSLRCAGCRRSCVDGATRREEKCTTNSPEVASWWHLTARSSSSALTSGCYDYQAICSTVSIATHDRDAAWCQPYLDVHLAMKWNDAWLGNQDCDGDGLLDRHYGFDSYIGSGAWVTNHQSGEYETADGETCKWNYFVKIVAAPADATADGGIWYTRRRRDRPGDLGQFCDHSTGRERPLRRVARAPIHQPRWWWSWRLLSPELNRHWSQSRPG